MSLATIQTAIATAARDACRDPQSVELLAVSKTRSAAEIAAVFRQGVTRFGENYLQEAVEKIHDLHSLPIEWHFIGPIQSNKTRDIATHFHWVHSVDRLKIARRLNDTLGQIGRTIDACIQVNIDHEDQKAGVLPVDLPALVKAMRTLEHIRLRGLMVIPKADADPRQRFAETRTLLADHQSAAHPEWDTLSMGMSSDFETAIAEGATTVRIGTAIFGPRTTKPSATRAVT